MLTAMIDRIGKRKPARLYLEEWMATREPPLNSKQVAERMNRSEATVSKLLNGGMKMTTDYLAEFAAALGFFEDEGDLIPDVARLFRDPARPTREEILRGYSDEELISALQLLRLSRNEASPKPQTVLTSTDRTPVRGGKRAASGK